MAIESIRLRWTCHVEGMEEGRKAFRISTGKPTAKKRLGRPRHRFEDSIRMDPNEIGANTRNMFDSAQDRNYRRAIVNVAFKVRVS